MQLLTPMAPQVIPGRAIDIVNDAPSWGMSRGFARVDLSDPVFFDHPLDHVPGMLLAVAILELAEHDSMLESDNVIFRLTFTRFCELNARVQVTATREACGTNRIQVTQSGGNIATGSLGRRETQPLMERVTVPVLEDAPISSELVHRADPRNIAVGPLTVDGGRVWTRVREQDAIDGLPPRAGAVASILEAARQFGLAIQHRWGEHPLGTKVIFVGLTAEVPTTVSVGQTARALSWHITPPEQSSKPRIDVYTIGDRATKVGSILMAGRCVDGDEYAQLRGC